MINDFAQNFQDVMSKERAEKKLFELKMEKGELDKYMSEFQQLAKLAGYHELTGMICRKYFQGLPKGCKNQCLHLNQPVIIKLSKAGLRVLSVSIANTSRTKRILEEKSSTPRIQISGLPDNSGNKVLRKTQMPWILPLDVPVPGLP